MKRQGRKVAALTAYDAPMARLLDQIGIDVVLVGDSVGMVKLGYDTTLPVTLQEMMHHTRAVRRGLAGSQAKPAAYRALLCADMPFLSYETSSQEAVRSAGMLIKAGAEAVKIEGGSEVARTAAALVRAKIAVMGHLGLNPQAVHQIGGYRVQGKKEAHAKKLLRDARALESAGVFSIVLEAMPSSLAKRITSAVSVPTIGIGAGPYCDGQILVLDDLLGLSGGRAPRFVKKYADLWAEAERAVREYEKEVRSGAFPSVEHTYD
jgi:3-methyl-2-oxobutanoate hydroxymethyltransferase